MPEKYARYVIYAMLWFGAWYLLAVVSFQPMTTISRLGTEPSSVVQYAIAVIGCSVFVWKAATILRTTGSANVLTTVIRGLCVASVAIVFLPYSVNTVFFWSHMFVSGLMALCGATASVMIAVRLRRVVGYLVCVVQMVALGIFLYTWPLTADDVIWRLQFLYELIMVYGTLFMLLSARTIWGRSIVSARQPTHNISTLDT